MWRRIPSWARCLGLGFGAGQADVTQLVVVQQGQPTARPGEGGATQKASPDGPQGRWAVSGQGLDTLGHVTLHSSGFVMLAFRSIIMLELSPKSGHIENE
jgi:hypothetical protein